LLAHGADPSIANSIYGGDAVFWAQESGVSRLHNHPLGKILPLLHEHKAKTKAAAAAGLAAASPAICAASAAVAGPLTPLRIPTPAMKESNRKSLLITATRALPALGLAAAAAAGLHTLASSPPTLQLMLGTGPHMAAAARPG
jgi:hypothetical protein